MAAAALCFYLVDLGHAAGLPVFYLKTRNSLDRTS
jgi:hypothetical protein